MKIVIITDRDCINFDVLLEAYAQKTGEALYKSWFTYEIHPELRVFPVLIEIIENTSGYRPIHGMKIVNIPDEYFWEIDDTGDSERVYFSKSPIGIVE